MSLVGNNIIRYNEFGERGIHALQCISKNRKYNTSSYIGLILH